MNWGSWLLWGFVSTVVLECILAGSQGLGITRMNVPYLLGTIFTPNRDRAKLIGILFHFLNGWVFSLIYVAVFNPWAERLGGWEDCLDLCRRFSCWRFCFLLCPHYTRALPTSSTVQRSSGNWNRPVFSGCTTAFARQSRSWSHTPSSASSWVPFTS